MTEEGFANLRDFIYLDVERVKSLLAQLDRGLLTDRTDSSGSSTTVGGKAGVTIPALLDVAGTGQYISTDQSTENRTLHDFVYNQTEEKLLEHQRIKRMPQDFSSKHLLDQEVRSTLSPVEYILVRGRVSLSDYQYMMKIMENINRLLSITTGFSHKAIIDEASDRDKPGIKKRIAKEISEGRLDDKFVKDLLFMFNMFTRDRLTIRILPFPEYPNIRIVGPLQAELLRERLEDIRFKFGSSPNEDWTVFGQIATVPSQHAEQLSKN